MRLLTIMALGCMLFGACRQTAQLRRQPDSGQVGRVISAMNEVMMHDVTNPPLAARFFAYATLAGYETLSHSDSTLRPFLRRINRYPVIPKPTVNDYDPELTALLAMLETAGRLQPSGRNLDSCRASLLEQSQKQGLSDITLVGSQTFAKAIADAVVHYARQDGYNRLSDYPRYTPTNGDGYWYPTPPAFLPAVEPHFGKIRPFLLDSTATYKPQPPTAFSIDKQSAFYQQMADVCRAGQTLTPAQKTIAQFWDCNPFAVQDAGHLQIGLKKMSPGAHWMKIAGAVCRQQDVSFSRTIQVNTVLAMTLMDAFVCCWDEKYRSNRIRPETVIHRYLDPDWKPLLQTPPFPEYVSGHSVISGASAEVLTHFFGDNLAYTDSTEIGFGLSPRRFTSFRQAAQEAGLSRFYGGIHFMDSVDEGLNEGKRIGARVVAGLSGKATQLAVVARQ
jgi:hypothetical protein